MAKRLGNPNLQDFLQAMQGKVITTPGGAFIRRSDLRDIEVEFGIGTTPGKRANYKTFDAAKQAFQDDHQELVQIADPDPPGHRRSHLSSR